MQDFKRYKLCVPGLGLPKHAEVCLLEMIDCAIASETKVAELQELVNTTDQTSLEHTRAICYMVGIAERGRGHELAPTEKATQVLLEYVQGLEVDRVKFAELKNQQRDVLRKIVDKSWTEITESEEVPSTKWADEIIDSVISASTITSSPHIHPTAVQAVPNEIKEVLIQAAQVVACRAGDVSTEDGNYATTCTDSIIRLEGALCAAMKTTSDDVELDEFLPLIERLEYSQSQFSVEPFAAIMRHGCAMRERVVLLSQYDHRKPEFWVDGVTPDGHSEDLTTGQKENHHLVHINKVAVADCNVSVEVHGELTLKDCEKISHIQSVHKSLQNFAHDSSDHNAARVVRSILEATDRQTDYDYLRDEGTEYLISALQVDVDDDVAEPYLLVSFLRNFTDNFIKPYGVKWVDHEESPGYRIANLPQWVAIENIEDIQSSGEELILWDGCNYAIDYVETEVDFGTSFFANGTEATHYLKGLVTPILLADGVPA